MKNFLKYSFFLAGLGTLPFLSWSAALNISPVHVRFAAGDKVETITLSNESNVPVTFQAEIDSWAQQNGKDINKPTKDLIVAPAILTIPANGKQFIRIARHINKGQKIEVPAVEQTYRLFLTQILPLAVGSSKTKTETIKTKLHISLPVFIEPANSVSTLVASKNGKNTVLKNTGNVTILINKIQWFNHTNPVTSDKAVFIYLLPGSEYSLASIDEATAIQVNADKKINLLELQ